MSKLPALFLGHGSPMTVLNAASPFNQGFARIARSFAKPQAILMISAHWYGNGLQITAAARPGLIYDFYGFPSALSQVQYPAPGSPELAAEVCRLLHAEGATPNPTRGFDHGMWTVLKHLYPEAGIPVVQLSLDRRLSSAQHFELAKKLKPLREQGVLIIGSGGIVHNLRALRREHTAYDWAQQFRMQINAALLSADHKALIDYPRFGQAAALSVPTPEHYLPLLYAAAQREEGEPIEIFNDHFAESALSMTSVKIGS
ncbi:4,5-DOPA dioxygenase extradiol [Eikenella sp. S3360]|uniref:4,5-DOPA dioxygenase extradiol n=1 Tax=Eikenella glucosivorans TaxID=2766967 RepID=A0ABS0NBD8_9NEIS|nr:4,5-DOPA dioxygenase extradiol [Eikenella glucosivorans]MBH5329606.1 4,5-DOPA dioxygenase extradiol [Eikenella glucosivorans]